MMPRALRRPALLVGAVSIVAGLAALAMGMMTAAAQAPKRPAPPLQVAARAYVEGRYDEVDQITDKLDAKDPNVAALRARAASARGRYAQAETILRPVAPRLSSSEAALELGLLEQMLGRTGAQTTLEKVAVVAETSDDPFVLARAARALRALGRFQEANAAYREAAGA